MSDIPTHPQIMETSSTESLITQTLKSEQVRSLYNSLPSSLASSLIIAIILSISHWNIIGKAEILLWNMYLVGMLLARLILWLLWKNTQQLYSLNLWLRAFRLCTWLTGAAWGAASLLLFAPNDSIYQALLVFSLAGVISGATTSLTADKYSALGFVLLTIAPFTYTIYQQQSPTAIAIVVMTILFILFVMTSTSRTRTAMENHIKQNQHLLALSQELHQKQRIEKIINNAQHVFIDEQDTHSALTALLEDTLSFSQCELGFIFQVKYDPQQKPYMQALIFSSTKNQGSIEHYQEKNLPPNGEFKNPHNLLGSIVETGKIVISNNLQRDMRTGGLPSGHPAINNFIGIPIFNHQNQQIAILGMANSPEDFTHGGIEKLNPLLQTIAHFILNFDQEQQHAQAKAALEASTETTKTILNDIADGIISFNRLGIIQSFNYAAETIFGYKATQIIGGHIGQLMTQEYKSEYAHYFTSQALSSSHSILGIGRQIMGQRRNGREFPMDLMISRVMQEKEPYFIGIVRDITAEKQQEEARIKFVANVKRDLRSPIKTLTEAMSMLNNTAPLAGDIQRLTAIAAQASVTLEQAMNALSSQRDIEQEPLHLAKHSVLPMVEDCVKRIQGFGDLYQINIHILSPHKHQLINIDPYGFDQILTYLLQKAIKQSDLRSSIRIVIEDEENKVKISLLSPSPADALTLEETHEHKITHPQNHEIEAEHLMELAKKMHGMFHLYTNNNTSKQKNCISALSFPLIL